VGGGLYARAASAAVYQDLACRAEDVIVGGYGAIVDASFLQRAQRALFIALARRLKVKLWLVSCDAPVGVLRARIVQRRRSGRDASEADRAVLEWQMAHREPVQPQEGIEAIEVSTAEPHALDQVLEAIGSSARA